MAGVHTREFIRRFVRPLRDLPAAQPAPPPLPSARKIAAWPTVGLAALPAEDAAALAAVTAACPHHRQLQAAIASFRDMTAGLTGARTLESWLTAAEASSLEQLASFARGIRKDHDAVLAGLSSPYNRGKVEGTVNKPKCSNARCTAAPASDSSATASCSTLCNHHHKSGDRAPKTSRLPKTFPLI